MATRARTAAEWIEEIDQGLAFRKLFGLEQTWLDLEAKFFSVSHTCDTGPNVLASKGDAIVSALSVPEVTAMVRPKTKESALTAPIVEAFDNQMLEGLDVADAMEFALTNAFLFGVGFVKLGYDSEYGYDPRLELDEVGGSLSQYDEKGRLLESGLARSGLPWGKAVLPHDVSLPWGTLQLNPGAPWVAHRVVRHVEDVKADKKYSNTSGLVGQVSMRDVIMGYSKMKETVEDAAGDALEPGGGKDFIELREVMERRTRKIFVIARGTRPVMIREIANTLQVGNQLPWVDVCLTLRTRAFWVTPPAYYAAPHQKELDDLHLQAKMQRRASVMKVLARLNALTPESREALLSGVPAMLVEVEDTNQPLDDIVKVIGNNVSINTLIHQEESAVQHNAREALGISRNLAGEYSEHARTTAAETDVVQKGGEMRLARKQKALRRAYRNFVRLLNGIVAAHWTTPMSIQVIGQDGAERWEIMRAEILQRGRFTYNISFSAEHFETPLARQRTAMQLYGSLMADPRVDKEALLEEVIASFGNPNVRSGPKPAGKGSSSDLQLQMPGVRGRGGAAQAPSTAKEVAGV